MTEKLVLVTGACGEIGQALVQGLARQGGYKIVTADLAPLPDSIKAMSAEHAQGDLVYKIKPSMIMISMWSFIWRLRFRRRRKYPARTRIASTWKVRCSC